MPCSAGWLESRHVHRIDGDFGLAIPPGKNEVAERMPVRRSQVNGFANRWTPPEHLFLLPLRAKSGLRSFLNATPRGPAMEVSPLRHPLPLAVSAVPGGPFGLWGAAE